MIATEYGVESQGVMDRLRAFPPSSYEQHGPVPAATSESPVVVSGGSSTQTLPGLSSMLHPRHAPSNGTTAPKATIPVMAQLPSSDIIASSTLSRSEKDRTMSSTNGFSTTPLATTRVTTSTNGHILSKKRRRDDREAMRTYGTNVLYGSVVRSRASTIPMASMSGIGNGTIPGLAPMKAAKRTENRNDPPIVAPAPIKSSRYLREIDRRVILSRIERGEKQATLAKEYQVSRAAICNLKKHRNEVLSRKDENPLAKHPKKPRPNVSKSKKTVRSVREVEQDALVHEMKTRSTASLLTNMCDRDTDASQFQRCTDRVLRILIEEALALVPKKKVEVFMNETEKVVGVGMKHPLCAVSMVETACPLLDTLGVIEPDCPTGSIQLEESAAVKLVDSKLPSDLNQHNVLLFDVALSLAKPVIAVIQLLLDRGAIEQCVSVVSLFVSPNVISVIRTKFPRVQVVTAQIESDVHRPTPAATSSDSNSTRKTSKVEQILARMGHGSHKIESENNHITLKAVEQGDTSMPLSPSVSSPDQLASCDSQ